MGHTREGWGGGGVVTMNYVLMKFCMRALFYFNFLCRLKFVINMNVIFKLSIFLKHLLFHIFS